MLFTDFTHEERWVEAVERPRVVFSSFRLYNFSFVPATMNRKDIEKPGDKNDARVFADEENCDPAGTVLVIAGKENE